MVQSIYKIIKAHCGKIKVESKVNIGTELIPTLYI